MSGTVEQFSRLLLDDDAFQQSLDPERLAAVFVRHFNLPERPGLDEVKALMERAGFGTVEEWEMDGLKGAHIGRPRGRYRIYCRGDLWEGTKAHTLLHEAYEIVMETMCDLHTDSPPQRSVCREADRFAAATLMQQAEFSRLAQDCGLDVAALQREFGCSYASVTLRLAEALPRLPLMAVLYERSDGRDPGFWTEPADLRAKIVRRTQGFGTPGDYPICGARGGIPRRGRPIPEGSLAARAARSGVPQLGKGGGVSAIAQPVTWNGKLAKVVVVAVREQDFGILVPQMEALCLGRRRSRPVAATAGPR